MSAPHPFSPVHSAFHLRSQFNACSSGKPVDLGRLACVPSSLHPYDAIGQVPELRLLALWVLFRLLTAFLLLTFPFRVFLFLGQLPQWLGLEGECRECMDGLGCFVSGPGLGLELELGWPAWLQLRQWWLQVHWLLM